MQANKHDCRVTWKECLKGAAVIRASSQLDALGFLVTTEFSWFGTGRIYKELPCTVEASASIATKLVVGQKASFQSYLSRGVLNKVRIIVVLERVPLCPPYRSIFTKHRSHKIASWQDSQKL